MKKSEILITIGMVWPVSSDKWKAPPKTFGPLLTAVNALSVKYEEITNLNVF